MQGLHSVCPPFRRRRGYFGKPHPRAGFLAMCMGCATQTTTWSQWEGGWKQVCFISSITMWPCKTAKEYKKGRALSPYASSNIKMLLVLITVSSGQN